MDFNKNYNLCRSLLSKYDKQWMVRRRKLNTETIFNHLVTGAITNTGISTHVNLQSEFSHSAMIKARKKLGENVFYDINSELHSRNYSNENHIYAIDGSKVPVPYGFKKIGYKTQTCDKVIRRPAKKPLAMLSALTGLQTDTIVNYTVTKHFNERKCVYSLIENLTSVDTVILDRGYYSKKLYSLFIEKNIKCIMRLKKDANKGARYFYIFILLLLLLKLPSPKGGL